MPHHVSSSCKDLYIITLRCDKKVSKNKKKQASHSDNTIAFDMTKPTAGKQHQIQIPCMVYVGVTMSHIKSWCRYGCCYFIIANMYPHAEVMRTRGGNFERAETLSSIKS